MKHNYIDEAGTEYPFKVEDKDQPLNKPQHTPPPWFAKVDSKNEKVDILTVEKPIKDDEENLRECVACVFDKANAAFIVRAVNCHEDLLKKVKLLIQLDDECRANPKRLNGLLSNVRQEVLDLIAQAEIK